MLFRSQYSHYQNSALIYQPAVDYVGCVMIIQGKLYNGFSHFAGELRCLPFYDHLQQERLLKDAPQELFEVDVLKESLVKIFLCLLKHHYKYQ